MSVKSHIVISDGSVNSHSRKIHAGKQYLAFHGITYHFTFFRNLIEICFTNIMDSPNIRIVRGNIFKTGDRTASLGNCISQDLKMSKGQCSQLYFKNQQKLGEFSPNAQCGHFRNAKYVILTHLYSLNFEFFEFCTF